MRDRPTAVLAIFEPGLPSKNKDVGLVESYAQDLLEDFSETHHRTWPNRIQQESSADTAAIQMTQAEPSLIALPIAA
jgi:hypothetical protein